MAFRISNTTLEQCLQQQSQQQLSQQQQSQQQSQQQQQKSQQEVDKGLGELSCKELTTLDAAEKFDFVRFTFSDIHGIGRTRLVPGQHFADLSKDKVQIFCGGIAFGPRSNYVPHDEILAHGHGNAVMRPCLETLVPLPWATKGEFRIGEVLCETFWGPSYKKKVLKQNHNVQQDAKPDSELQKASECQPGGTTAVKLDQILKDDDGLFPQEACPRYVTRRLLQRLEEEFGFIMYSSFEAEFINYKAGTLEPVFQDNNVCSSYNTSEFEPYLGRLYKGLSAAGVEVETLQTEFEFGQFELALRPAMGIATADGMFRLKHAVKEISRQQGMDATFMTMPDFKMKCSGTGLHFNHSLLDKTTKQNVMYSPRDEDNLSDVMRWWLAGLLKHSASLTALCCPTYNCYRRLHVNPAPGKINWGLDDRFTTYRIKSVPGPSACAYVESRLPSGAANSYLVMAATLAAGMSGLRQRLTCPQENSSEAQDLPKSLEEALTCLEKDEIMVEALGEEFVKWFVRVKRDIEIAELKDNRIELERDMYMQLL